MRATYLCILILVICSTMSCLGLHSVSLQTQNDEHVTYQSLNKQINHQGAATALKDAIKQAKLEYEQFQKSCQTTDKKKINWIDIQNRLDEQLRYVGLTQQEGDIFSNGEPILRQNQTTRWIFVQTSRFKGTKGMIVYKIKDGSHNSLVVYFNSPTGNAWNSFGVCITSQKYPEEQKPLSRQTLQSQYNQILKSLWQPSQTCILSDNSKDHTIPQYFKAKKVIKSQKRTYAIALVEKYEKTRQFLINCYRQQVVVVIDSS